MNGSEKLVDTLNKLPGVAPLGIDAFNLLGNLLTAIALGIIIAIVYRNTRLKNHAGVFSPEHFILLCGTVSLIVAFVQSSLSLSLGLLGAISIIRYRTAIKDPEELIYIFITIAAGIGAGIGYKIATVAAVTLLLSIALLAYARNRIRPSKKPSSHVAELTTHNSQALNWGHIQPIFEKHFGKIECARISRTEAQQNYTIVLEGFDESAFVEFENELSEISPHFDLHILTSTESVLI